MKKIDKFTKNNNLDIQTARKTWPIPQKDLVKSNSKNKIKNIDYDKLKAIVESNSSKINDAKGIMELLPDLYLVKEVLIASILSPKDLSDTDLSIKIDKDAPAEIAEIVRVHLSSTYNLNSKLSEILGEALFEIGSYSLLALPANTISNLINTHNISLEDISGNGINDVKLPPIGILKGNNDTLYCMEDLSIENGNRKLEISKMEISDNIQYLATPMAQSLKRKNILTNRLKDVYGLEGINDKDKTNNVYLKRRTLKEDQINIKKEEKITENNINPIVLNLPAESVIPVSVPGEPENHVGYYIVIDKNGHPIKTTKNSSQFKDLNDRLERSILDKGASNVVTTSLIGTIKKDDSGVFTKPLLDSYINGIEKELKNAVKDGIHNGNVEVSAPENLYRLMFARQLENQLTRIIYVPSEMLTYIAFNYDEMGLGISLIEKTKMYASLRAILLFAKMMASIKNSVPSRTLSIVLDDDDSDPQGTIEKILSEYAALQANGLPVGKLSPTDIVDALQKAGVQIKIDGGELFPNTGIEVEDHNADIPIPNSDLSDDLKHAHYSGLGVSPESVDASLELDFATTATASNLLQSKRVMIVQKSYVKHLSDFIHSYIFAGGPLFKQIKDKYNENENNILTLEEVINSITVLFPKADTAFIKAQNEAFNDYSEFIETAIELYISEEMLVDMLDGEFTTDSIESVKVSLLSFLKRQYLDSQNMLPEMANIITKTDNNIATTIKHHNSSVLEIVGDLFKALRKKENKVEKSITKVIDKIESGEEEGDKTAIAEPVEEPVDSEPEASIDEGELPADEL